MIRDLYINEELIIYMKSNNILRALWIEENIPKEVNSRELEFIRNKASIMEKLRKENVMQITTDGNKVTSSLDFITGEGLSIPTSIEDLEFNLNAKRR